MNFSELRAKVIQQLAESTTPQYWSQSEIDDNINEGYREILRRCGLNRYLLPLLQSEVGKFYLPHDLMVFKKLYFQGRPLSHQSIEYLESRYSGNSFDDSMVGAGRYHQNNFRENEGDPIHWFLENGKINLYPKPTSDVSTSATVLRRYTTATLSAGSLTLTLSVSIPTDQARVEVWLNGIYQHHDQWSITNETTITFVGSASGIDLDAVVRYIPDSITGADLSETRKHIINLSAGQTVVQIPGGYTQGIGALSLSINGVTQSPSVYSETSTSFITLDSGPVADSVAEVTVTYPDPFNVCGMLYLARPQELSNDSDQPDILPLDFHKGVWEYACYLCLKREGKKTQDLQKAQMRLADFEQTIDPLLQMTTPEITIDPKAALAFTINR